jgi:hypothetical protein
MDRLNRKLALTAVYISIAIVAYLLMLEILPPDGSGLGGQIGSAR